MNGGELGATGLSSGPRNGFNFWITNSAMMGYGHIADIFDKNANSFQIFWITYDDLLQKYSTFERTRLFDNEWQTAQQWTTVNVPWSADYNHTKFRVTLAKRSPVVIVLSQVSS